MTDTDQAQAGTKTPWHLWAVGVVSLLWNSGGAYDYIMTNTKNETYMEAFTPEQLAYFYNFPTWFVAFWAIAVWGAVLGSVLLLLRKSLAVSVFAISFIVMTINAIYSFGFSNGFALMGTGGAIFSGAIFLISLFLWFYSRRMHEAGRLT